MNSQELLKEALQLKPQERTLLIDGLLSSLDEPDKTVEQIWHEEIEKRAEALRNGKLQTISYNKIIL